MSVKVKFFERERYFDKIYLCFETKMRSDNIMIEIELLEKYDAVLKRTKVRNYFRKRPSSHSIIKLFRDRENE
jgi:hypothetical protein